MKNIQIEFWRFTFAIYMVIYHTLGYVYNMRTGGYIGVDLFAVLSGFFLASSCVKQGNRVKQGGGIITYAINRFMRLWPSYFFRIFDKRNIAHDSIKFVVAPGP